MSDELEPQLNGDQDDGPEVIGVPDPAPGVTFGDAPAPVPDEEQPSAPLPSTERPGALREEPPAQPPLSAENGGDPQPGPEPEPAPGPVTYHAGEKIAAVLDTVFNNPNPPDDPRARAVLQAFRTARRFGLTSPVERIFPPLDNARAWDEWLALAVGVCLNLTSDGYDVDVDVVRAAGAEVLGELFA